MQQSIGSEFSWINVFIIKILLILSKQVELAIAHPVDHSQSDEDLSIVSNACTY